MLTQVIYLTRKADRERMAADIRKALEPLGVAVEVREGLGRCLFVNLAGEGLEASVSLDASNGSEAPLIHWHNAARPLAGVRGAWVSVNAYHGLKATSLPSSMIDLIEKLQRGFRAAADGSAFRNPPADAEAVPAKPVERQQAPKGHGWKVRRASQSLQACGNRDLYLTHAATGAAASIAPDRSGLYKVHLAGAAFPGSFSTRGEAFAHVLQYGLAAYFETTPEVLAAFAKVGLDRWQRQQMIRERISAERGLNADAWALCDDPEYLKACEALDRLTLARAASLEVAA
ncbi:hypothetical protein [Sphingomonas asaccharolytica]|uniref:hypothetical protein n=1 Tax=Sphingomonas asaccharolytica TaxID=40681 RepID=UPI0008334365|nr:hypothetical protein [Sphingomonas asaccharolytica]